MRASMSLLTLLLLIPFTVQTHFECSRPQCMSLDSLISQHKLPLHRTVPTSAEAFHVYCYKGPHTQTPSALLHVWDTIEISVATSKDVPPVQLVPMEYNNTQDNAGSSHLTLSPVGESCVKVKRTDHTPSSDGNEYVLMATRSLSLHYPLLLAIGLALFFVAPSLSRNIGVYYSSSVLLGVVLSLLLLLFIFYRMVPKSSVIGWGVLLGGYTAVVSVLYWGFVHFMEKAMEYGPYLLGYVVVAGLISFAVVYRLGAPDPRTMNLLQWGAQLVATVMIYASLQQLPWLALFGVISTVTLPYTINLMYWVCAPICCCLKPLTRCLAFFNPFKQRYPKRRLLTMEEYDRVGEVETRLALDKLREHCKRTPGMRSEDIWATVSRLKDPKRFTEFLSGQPHVSSEEQAEHEFSFIVEDSSDDESETTSSSIPSSQSPSPLQHTAPQQTLRHITHAPRT